MLLLRNYSAFAIYGATVTFEMKILSDPLKSHQEIQDSLYLL